MTPGLPQAARHYSERVGRVMNYGDGLYGGIFVTSMYGAAFFESDPPNDCGGRACERCPRRAATRRSSADVLDVVADSIPTTGGARGA